MAFELVALAAVVVELDRAVALDDRREEAARADGGKLGRVADQHRLPLCVLDLDEHARERAGVGHPGLVDDEQAAPRETAPLSCFGEEAVEGAARDAGLGGEIRGGDAGGGGADRDVAVASEGVGERGERGRLAGAGVADDADDAVRARRDGVAASPSARGRAVGRARGRPARPSPPRRPATRTRRPRAASPSAARSWREQLGGREEAGRPTAAERSAAICSVAMKRSTRASTRSAGAPWVCACAQAITASVPVNVERFPVKPSGPASCAGDLGDSRSSSSRTSVRSSSRFSSRRPRPCSAARACHSSRMRGRSTGSLRSRVSSAATLAA